MLCYLLSMLAATTAADMVSNWQARLLTPSGPNFYKVLFEWDHEASEAVTIGFTSGLKPTDDPRCSGSSSETAADGQPYWMPRFYQRNVSEEIKRQTGIQFASVDWQPCGHKDITICHGESHYDFHLYYVDEARLAAMPMCDIGTRANPHLPVCEDGPSSANGAYYKMIDSNMPISAQISSSSSTHKSHKTFDYCVDPSSAILRSGIHYGDASETLDEWKTPVTIIGSHDCQLMFFEPMISWKWISGSVSGDPHWPHFNVNDIQYNRKTFQALPHSWGVVVSDGCKTGDGRCHIQVTVEGTRCPSIGGCPLTRECGRMKNCHTNSTYTPLRSTATSTAVARFSFIGFLGGLGLAVGGHWSSVA